MMEPTIANADISNRSSTRRTVTLSIRFLALGAAALVMSSCTLTLIGALALRRGR